MKIISNLPTTSEDVAKFTLDELVKMVLDLANPANKICGQAGMQCNTFMSLAALRMAKSINSLPLERDHMEF